LYNSLWQDRLQTLRGKLEGLARKCEDHINNFDVALHRIEEPGILYKKLEGSEQKRLLRQMLEKISVIANSINKETKCRG